MEETKHTARRSSYRQPPGSQSSQAIQRVTGASPLSWVQQLYAQGEGGGRACGRGPGGGARRGRQGRRAGETIRGRGAAGVSRGGREGEGAREAGTTAGEVALVDVVVMTCCGAKGFGSRVSVRRRPKVNAYAVEMVGSRWFSQLGSG